MLETKGMESVAAAPADLSRRRLVNGEWGMMILKLGCWQPLV
jgi:hypothetical protein